MRYRTKLWLLWLVPGVLALAALIGNRLAGVPGRS